MGKTPKIEVSIENGVWLRISSISIDSGSIQMELKEAFSYLAPNYRFDPRFKRKQWDGYIALYNLASKQMYLGLISDFYEFCAARDYRLAIADESRDNALKYLSSQELTEEDVHILDKQIPKKYDLRDYQAQSIKYAIENKRCLISSSVGSGKSLIIYTLSLWYLIKHYAVEQQKVLIVVPTVNLVSQMKSDFIEYAENNIEDFDETIHCIFSGQEKINISKYTIVISTFQSLTTKNIPHEWFKQFGMIIVDEAHRGAIKSLSNILEKTDEAVYRIGTSGSIDINNKNNSILTQQTLKGLFGSTYQAITTKQLQDRDQLAQLQIDCVILKYPKEIGQKLTQMNKKASKEKPQEKFQNELDIILDSANRNKLIADYVVNKLEGNTLILFRFIKKHGEPLFKTIQNLAQEVDSKKKIHFVSGATPAEDRETIRKLVDRTSNNVLVSSIQVFSEGINIPELHNVVFAMTNKSHTKVIQSIGRGLRIAKNGQATKVIDFIDDIFAYKKSQNNYCVNHALQRMQYYEQEQFKYRIIDVPFIP